MNTDKLREAMEQAMYENDKKNNGTSSLTNLACATTLPLLWYLG